MAVGQRSDSIDGEPESLNDSTGSSSDSLSPSATPGFDSSPVACSVCQRAVYQGDVGPNGACVLCPDGEGLENATLSIHQA